MDIHLVVKYAVHHSKAVLAPSFSVDILYFTPRRLLFVLVLCCFTMLRITSLCL